MKTILARLRNFDPRLVLAAFFAMAILHVATTFAAPSIAMSTAWGRLAPALKSNTMVVFPPITPDTQP
ncbi:MAG: hypothetical protein WBY12_14340, partial [Hyphomicrobium sp.]